MEWIIGFIILIIFLFSNFSNRSSKNSNQPEVKSDNRNISSSIDKKSNLQAFSKKESKKLSDKEINELLKDLDFSIKKSKLLPESNSKIASSLKNKGVNSLWHMTHKNNIIGIFNDGILSHTQAFKLLNPTDISNSGVQEWRERREPVFNRKIHDYAPMYLNIKNPMLYVKKDIQNDLCLIEVSLSVISDDNCIFTDGNAASRDTKFYNSPDALEYLPWNVLSAKYWNDFEDGKRKRCAEVLIYPKIDKKHILRIHCNSSLAAENISMQISHLNIPVSISKNLFF